MKIDDGGPAFPHPVNKHECGFQYAIVDGMSLRDWFAGLAGEEALSLLTWYAGDDWKGNDIESAVKELARVKSMIADAMLAERAKTSEHKRTMCIDPAKDSLVPTQILEIDEDGKVHPADPA